MIRKSVRAARPLARAVAVIGCLGLSGCIHTFRETAVERVDPSSASASASADADAALRVHLRDGAIAVFPGGAVVGRIELERVLGMERYQTRSLPVRSVLVSTGATVGLLLGVLALACLADCDWEWETTPTYSGY